jgi:hypothetical protein
MALKQSKLQDVLKSRGIKMADVVDTQDYKIPEAKESTKKLMEIYYNLKVTADMEAPYWYNRTWWENDGDVTIVRRAKAMAACLSHITPTILPYEKLVMNKTKNVRGAFPFPWVCASFFNAQAEALMNEVDAPEESEADSVSVVGAGGPPMAVAPLSEVRKVINYAVSVIPSKKILMGIPMYGYDWTLPYTPGGEFAESIGHQEAVNRARRYGAEIKFDERAQSPYFNYVDEEGRQHVVWFEDARSIQAKYKLVNEYDLRGVSYWTLSQPFPQNWYILNNMFEITKVIPAE